MAQPGSPSNNATVPAASSSAATLPDWEMLSLSMSGSALGKPRDSVTPLPENPSSQIESSFSEFDPGNPYPVAAVWGGSLHNSVNRDGRADVVAEPFTEGWKPHLSPPSGLYGCDAERRYGGQQREEDEDHLSSQGAEIYDDSNASVVMPEGSFVSVKGVARSLSCSPLDVVDFGLGSSPKTRRKGGKRSKTSSRVLWSIGVMSAMLGVAILGHHWRLACRDNQQLRMELAEKDEVNSDTFMLTRDTLKRASRAR